MSRKKTATQVKSASESRDDRVNLLQRHTNAYPGFRLSPTGSAGRSREKECRGQRQEGWMGRGKRDLVPRQQHKTSAADAAREHPRTHMHAWALLCHSQLLCRVTLCRVSRVARTLIRTSPGERERERVRATREERR